MSGRTLHPIQALKRSFHKSSALDHLHRVLAEISCYSNAVDIAGPYSSGLELTQVALDLMLLATRKRHSVARFHVVLRNKLRLTSSRTEPLGWSSVVRKARRLGDQPSCRFYICAKINPIHTFDQQDFREMNKNPYFLRNNCSVPQKDLPLRTHLGFFGDFSECCAIFRTTRTGV
jgi:hypothetical protein